MKKNLLFISFSLATLALLWMSNSGGRATVAMAGSTGAPGENSAPCGNPNCHGGTSISVDMVVSLLDGNGESVLAYMPGETYTARVEFDHTGGAMPAGYGFQMTALLDNAENASVSSFANPDENTQIAEINATNRQYAEHRGPNTNTNFFEVEWTAPTAGSGPVTFYAAGLGVNGNFGPSGDGSAMVSLGIQEDMSTSVVNPLSKVAEVGPNPIVGSHLYIRTELPAYSWTVLNSAGQSVVGAQQGQKTTAIDATAWMPGLYLLRVQSTDGRIFTEKIIKN